MLYDFIHLDAVPRPRLYSLSSETWLLPSCKCALIISLLTHYYICSSYNTSFSYYTPFRAALQVYYSRTIDQFYTYVGYFNSLKELGSNSIIISDRISAEINYLATYKFKKEAESVKLKVDSSNADIPPYFKSNELTSRNSAKEIKAVLERLANKYTSEDCYDYIMASNMLSVGIDIDRLGVMCVYGQPKSNSEYIQATSRVGRTNPGLVISLYNSMRSRDKSYYEQFGYYHSTFYKYVEATSVTSYSPRAIEKALHCAMMAIIRHIIPKYNPNENACKFIRSDKDVERVKRDILNRVGEIEPRIVSYAEEWLNTTWIVGRNLPKVCLTNWSSRTITMKMLLFSAVQIIKMDRIFLRYSIQ